MLNTSQFRIATEQAEIKSTLNDRVNSYIGTSSFLEYYAENVDEEYNIFYDIMRNILRNAKT